MSSQSYGTSLARPSRNWPTKARHRPSNTSICHCHRLGAEHQSEKDFVWAFRGASTSIGDVATTFQGEFPFERSATVTNDTRRLMDRLIAGLQVGVIRKSQNPALLSLGLPVQTSFSWILLHLCRQEDGGGLEGVLDISERSRSESRLVNHSYRQVAWPLLEESWKERLILVCPTRDPFHPFPTVSRRANHGPEGLTGHELRIINKRHTPSGISGAVHGSWPSDVAWRRGLPAYAAWLFQGLLLCLRGLAILPASIQIPCPQWRSLSTTALRPQR
jgi:hypothetical protein